jgi:FtsH-binding integral membrane protein
MHSKWLPDPELDEPAGVGLTFTTIGYGVVLVAVFPYTSLSAIGVAGWFRLGLAISVVIISYIGYCSNRREYPVWKVKFFNVPLLQYIISFVILFLYWELGRSVPRWHSHPPIQSEAVIILAVFAAYLVWDFLEVAVQEGDKYIHIMGGEGYKSPIPPVGEFTQRPGRRHIKARDGRFAKNARASRTITFAFTLLSAGGLLFITTRHLQGTTSEIAVDSIYIFGLFAYRYCQWWWAEFWYRPVL